MEERETKMLGNICVKMCAVLRLLRQYRASKRRDWVVSIPHHSGDHGFKPRHRSRLSWQVFHGFTQPARKMPWQFSSMSFSVKHLITACCTVLPKIPSASLNKTIVFTVVACLLWAGNLTCVCSETRRAETVDSFRVSCQDADGKCGAGRVAFVSVLWLAVLSHCEQLRALIVFCFVFCFVLSLWTLHCLPSGCSVLLFQTVH